LAAPDPTARRAQAIAAQIAFAAALLLVAAMAAGLLWAQFAGAFAPPPPPAPPPPRRPAPPGEPPPLAVRRRPPERARPFHDRVVAGYRAGTLDDEDVLGAVHALYHEWDTDEAHALAADLEQLIEAPHPSPPPPGGAGSRAPP
jgi:hypothetical protein